MISFFSIGFELILIDQSLPYNLYVNSAVKLGREKFLKIYPKGEKLTNEELSQFKAKYHQLYVAESERSIYLMSLCSKNRDKSKDQSRVNILKESAIHYLGKIFDSEREFTTQVLDQAIEGCKESVMSMVEVVQDYDISAIQSMIGELSFHDFYTYDHSVNVSMYNILIYKQLKPQASKKELVTIGLGGLLHDMGKTKISTSIINNAGKLSEEEFEIVKTHPTLGLEMIEQSSYQRDSEEVDFEAIKRVIYEHHENYNGSGYPQKLQGEQIHLMARITAISDFFDALTTKRAYHEAMEIDKALGVMEMSKSKKIDPKLFDVFASKVKNIDLDKLTERYDLPLSFDPCQPHSKLPLRPVFDAEKNIKQETPAKHPVNHPAENEKDKNNLKRIKRPADVYSTKLGIKKNIKKDIDKLKKAS